MKTNFLSNVKRLQERRYRAIWLENELCDIEFGLTDEIDADGDDYEWKFSILDDYCDELFELERGEEMYFKPERDSETIGIIKRIK